MRKNSLLAFRWILPVLLVVQVLFLCITMFAAGDTILDGDVARQYTHMIAMWESGTPFVPDWVYTTTMEVDTAVLLALPFYGLLGDATLAFCCANIVNIAMWIGFIFLFCRRVNQQSLLRINPWLACILILIPYSAGNLYYWNMMFLNCSPYTFKVLLPLLLIYLLLTPSPKTPQKHDWILLTIYLFVLGLTSLSSGIYVAAMGIAPVLLAFAVLWLYEKVPLTLYYWICTLGSVAITLLGRLVGLLMGVDISGGYMNLNSMDTLAANIGNNLVGFFRLFGAVTRDKTAVTRLSGMAQLLCWGIALVMLYRCMLVLLRGVRGKLCVKEYPAVYLAAPAIWNFLLLTILDTHYGDPYFEVRYHLIGGIPLLLLVAAHFPKAHWPSSQRFRYAMRTVGTLALCALVFLCDRRAYLVYWKTDGTVGINAKEHKLCEEIEKMDVTDVFVFQSNTTTEICGLLDRNHRYKLLWPQEDACYLYTFDAPMSDIDAHPDIGEAALVLASGSSLSELPPYLQNVTYYSQTENYTIYLLENGSLPDGLVGLPYNGVGLDYPNSTGYTYQGSIDQNRSLDTEGNFGVVLQSPSLSLCTTADISLAYSSSIQGMEVLGHVTIRQGDTVVQTQDLLAADSALSFCGIPAGDNYQIEVELLSGARITLESITFTPQQ